MYFLQAKTSPALFVELVGKHKVIRLTVETSPCHYVRRSIHVDNAREIGDLGNLTRRVDSSEVISSIALGMQLGIECDYRISGEEGDEAGKEEDEAADVGKSAGGEDGPPAIILLSSADVQRWIQAMHLSIPLRIGVVQIVIRFRVPVQSCSPSNSVCEAALLVTDRRRSTA